MLAHFFKLTQKKFISFRNIATCAPSQNLFDDITSPANFDLIHRHERAGSLIDHKKQNYSRPFQYGDTTSSLYVFEKLNWYYGRFSNGKNYGVWYGALEIETSIQEVLYYRIRESRDLFANPKIKSSTIVHQRALFQARCASEKMVDLTKEKKMASKLISNDYSFCQSLAEKARAQNIDGFLTPSARKLGGICTPLFNPAIIRDHFMYYFDFIIHRDFTAQFKKSVIKKMTVPKEWLN